MSINSFNLEAVLWSNDYYHPYFIDGEIEAVIKAFVQGPIEW